MYRINSFKYSRRAGSKYANKPKDFNGRTYHSIFEAKVARDLEMRRRAGEIKSWTPQVKIRLEVYGKHICDYWIDFMIEHKSGEVEYCEAKGYPTPEWRIKWKLFEAIYNKEHPDAILTVKKQ